MALAKFAVTQRQIAVAFYALLKNKNVPRAIHGLERIVPLLRLRSEHVFAVLIPVPRFFPQGFVNDLGAFDFQVPVVLVDLAHVLLNALPQSPAFGMPKNQARCVFINME